MGALAIGDVVLVEFPYSDLSSRKLRPAVVLACAEKEDLVVCQITSRPYSSSNSIELAEGHFRHGGLSRVSYARFDKLFTASPRTIRRTVGALDHDHVSELRAAVAALFA